LSLEKKIELISDLVKYQDHYKKVYKFQNQQRKPMSKKQKREYYMAVIKSYLGWRFKDFKGMSFEDIEAKFTQVWKRIEDFAPMGSKEEAERAKRQGIILEKEQLVSVEDVYVQALQVKHSIIDWKVHSEGERNYWQIIRLGCSTACYQFFVDLLRQLDREDLNQLWTLVKEYLSIIPAANDKEMELWVELKRMYEPDPEDQLWTLTQNYMHAPVEWKLYDLSGVHHVIAKDKEIFMLVEKDYPLRRGLALVMIKGASSLGRIVGNKMHKAFPLPGESSHWKYKFPLPESDCRSFGKGREGRGNRGRGVASLAGVYGKQVKSNRIPPPIQKLNIILDVLKGTDVNLRGNEDLSTKSVGESLHISENTGQLITTKQDKKNRPDHEVRQVHSIKSFGDHPQQLDQSLFALGPNRLCARAPLEDDMPFHTQACKEYTRRVFISCTEGP
nr:hypothetical protein [Tanacetum cinerariifolium]